MSEGRGKKRSKAFYRKSGHGKRQKTEGNRLMPGLQGFLVMCNNNEMNAVRESYNILNEYADAIYGQGKSGAPVTGDNTLADVTHQTDTAEVEDGIHHSDTDSEDDLEAALKKEVEGMKAVPSELKRFQNCKTQAKNCVFIRSTVADPVKVAVAVMEDIASRQLLRARYAARILPVVGTCKAHTSDITKLAERVLRPVFAANANPPSSYTIVFKARNNNTSSCGKVSLIPALTQVVKEINPAVTFTWSNFDLAVLVEVVCTVCCLVIAPSYIRLRKYNLQELSHGPKCITAEAKDTDIIEDKVTCDTAEVKEVSVNSKTDEESINNKDLEEGKSAQCVDKCKDIDGENLKELAHGPKCITEDKDTDMIEVKVTCDTTELKDVSVHSKTEEESANNKDKEIEEGKSAQCVDGENENQDGKIQEDIVKNQSISHTEECTPTGVESTGVDKNTEKAEKNA